MPCDYPQGIFKKAKVPCEGSQGIFKRAKVPCDYPQGVFKRAKVPCDYPQGIFERAKALCEGSQGIFERAYLPFPHSGRAPSPSRSHRSARASASGLPTSIKRSRSALYARISVRAQTDR